MSTLLTLLNSPALKWISALSLAVALLIAPFTVYPLFLMNVFCFVLFASALNLVLGYAGLLSLGHAAFFGGAAYVTAHVAKEWGWPFEIAILAGMAFAALIGLVMGLIGIKRHGIYFAMITLALAQMIYFLAVQMPFTNGEDGIQSIPRGTLLGLIDLSDIRAMYFVVLSLALLGLLLIWRTIHSPFGHILAAIRENEPRAVSLGLDVARYKLMAFVLSATLSGLAGSLKVLSFQLAALSNVSWHLSGEVVLMTLIGGLGTFAGPIIGSTFVVALEHYLATSGLPVSLVVGVIFMACVMLFRRGIWGEAKARLSAMMERQDPDSH
ncbi:amino acid/amide ABC transporter membrane protein 2, HAAT family [Roseovarius azorensis]|uniref:Amino acid/amide ABC transporter membrane protein 2, HAAT family n=1 Tax=Roseovarius azorensis TaxID=1287727 RepID=A0A1H7XDU7_9RHOB|nr:branched-chain amino acid ABC transporter permease [Roseovarius azorensis]SEM31804.1 amino acid/amide ABC transporter membrane protein 2, HAAT family [Roseovarius azorensis]